MFAKAHKPYRHSRRSCHPKHSQRGYILITLIFAFAVLIIIAAALAPAFVFEVKRDREEEMIHRGVQYSRAIRAFVKKTGNYPVRLEQLDNTNQIKFLRRHYKDPITGKDFKLLHQGDVPFLNSAAGLTGAAALGGANGVAGAQGVQQQAAQIAQGLAAGQAAQNSGNSLFGNANNGSSNTNTQNDQPGLQFPQSGSGSGGNDNSNSGDSGSGQPAQPPPAPGPNFAGGSTVGPGASPGGGTNGNQVFGGGPIVGVASVSKDKTIRIFNKKDHYKDWYFVYDPSIDRGTGLINGPYQPPLQGNTPNLNGQQPNANGQQGNSGSIFGNPGNGPQGNSGFGGTQNNNSGSPNTPGGIPQQAPGQLPEQ